MGLDMDKLLPSIDSIPEKYKINFNSYSSRYLIDGRLEEYPGELSEVSSPIFYREGSEISTPLLGSYPLVDEAIAKKALSAAEKAWDSGMGTWPQMNTGDRITYMREFRKQMALKQDEFALLEMWEIAKPYPACVDEFQRTLQYIDDTIERLEEADLDANAIKSINKFTAQVRRCPLGISLCMGPFNYPLNETFAMLIPALIMGNPVIVKLPRYGCLCSQPLLEAFAQVFPPGVINIINGDGPTIISPILKSGKISVLAFIGATETARILIKQHPFNNRLKTILGLEAKNPAFVFPDCDLELAVNECINGALEFNGQRCTSLKHIWVHQDIAEEFVHKMSSKLSSIKYGMPWEEDVMITPLAEKGKCKQLSQLLEDSVNKGARVHNLNGGKYKYKLFYPAMLYPVTPQMDVYHLEQFGPLIPIGTFKHIDDLKDYLRNCDYGQQASIFTCNPATAASLIDILSNQVSRINLNAQCRRSPDDLPFTGRKNSAEGTLSISDALRSFSLPSLVVANDLGRELFFDIIASKSSEFLRL